MKCTDLFLALYIESCVNNRIWIAGRFEKLIKGYGGQSIFFFLEISLPNEKKKYVF